MTFRNFRRKALNNVMLSITGIFAFITVSSLFLILAYLVYNGGKSVDLDFFTQLPKSTVRTQHRDRLVHFENRGDPFTSCPPYPRQRTFVGAGGMSEKCQ